MLGEISLVYKFEAACLLSSEAFRITPLQDPSRDATPRHIGSVANAGCISVLSALMEGVLRKLRCLVGG